MAWKMIGQPKTRRVTRALAEEFSGMTPAPHDRPLNATRAAILKTAVDKQLFRTCEWASAYCIETKQTYRINGKHTSTVLSAMNGEFPKNLSVIVEHYECDTLEDVANLYSTFDTRSSARSTGDINRIFAATCDAIADLPPRIIDLAVTGMSYELWEDNYSHQPPVDRAQLSIGNSAFVVWLADIIRFGKDTSGQAKESRHLRRSPVVAAMFRTWKKSRQAATEFWKAVRDGTGKSPSSPDRKLQLLLVGANVHNNQPSNSKSMGRREVYVKCLHAWNAWRNDGNTDMKYYPNAKTPPAQ